MIFINNYVLLKALILSQLNNCYTISVVLQSRREKSNGNYPSYLVLSHHCHGLLYKTTLYTITMFTINYTSFPRITVSSVSILFTATVFASTLFLLTLVTPNIKPEASNSMTSHMTVVRYTYNRIVPCFASLLVHCPLTSHL